MEVLVADDDPIGRLKLKRQLEKWNYRVIEADTGEKAWDYLQHDDAPAFAILDWMMPGLDGIELCRRIRGRESQETGHYTFVIMITARDNLDDLVVAMEAGADDFISKPYNPVELRVRVKAAQRILDLQNQLIAARENFRDQAQRDPMTGVLNHQAILDALGVELDRAKRSDQAVSCILADLDHFKNINDTYGHQAGDKVLMVLSRCLAIHVRKYDLVGRYGGEEFMVVLPGSPPSAAAEIAERIRGEIEATTVETDGGNVGVTISMGVASSACFPQATAETLVAEADKALYVAKGQGRNRVIIAPSQPA